MSHGLPYDWSPLGAVQWFEVGRVDGTEKGPLEVGTLIPWAHEVYVVQEVRPVPEDQWTDDERAKVFRARLELDEYKSQAPALTQWWRMHLCGGTGPSIYTFVPHPVPVDPVKAADVLDRDRLECRGWIWKGQQNALDFYPDEHYPICAECRQPAPCRDKMAMLRAAESLSKMDQYSDPGKCPECRREVRPRQARETFAWNLYVPGGPPVTFHAAAAGKCVYALAAYREQLKASGYFTLKALDPDGADHP